MPPADIEELGIQRAAANPEAHGTSGKTPDCGRPGDGVGDAPKGMSDDANPCVQAEAFKGFQAVGHQALSTDLLPGKLGAVDHQDVVPARREVKRGGAPGDAPTHGDDLGPIHATALRSPDLS